MRVIECEVCHRRFGEKGSLRTHIRTVHEGVRGFECEVCHRRFGQKGSLRTHIRTVHEGDRVRGVSQAVRHIIQSP
jgi:uncharacterized Zn-finger protein